MAGQITVVDLRSKQPAKQPAIGIAGIYSAIQRFTDKAFGEYRVIASYAHTSLVYRPTTPALDGDVLVINDDDEIPEGYEMAMPISRAWDYQMAKRKIHEQLRRLPILPMEVN